MITTSVAVGPRSGGVPSSRSRGVLAFLLPLPVAAAAGLAVGLSPATALAVEGAIVSALVLVTRLEWAALAVIGSAVFEDYLDLVSPWTTEWLAAVLVVAWMVRRAQGPLHASGLRVVTVPAAIFAGALAVAFAAHPHGRPGLAVCADYLEFVVVMLVLADCLCGPLAPRRAARVYVVSCLLAACCGLVTAVLSERHRVAGPVAGSDDLAFFLVAAVPLVGTLRSRDHQPVWWVWAAFAVLMAAGVGTQSRPAFVALVAMVLLAVLTGLLALRLAGVLLALVMTAVALVVAVIPVPIGQALTDPQRYAETNIAQRVDLRLAALHMTAASPVVGLGPASFALVHGEHLPDDADPPDAELDTAYSTPLEASAELGLLGLAALYTLWLLPVGAAVRRWRRDRAPLVGGVLLAGGGLLTAALLETEQYALPLWFLAAMVLALGRPERLRRPVFASAEDGRSSGQVPPEW